jgi:hypothetical protein
MSDQLDTQNAITRGNGGAETVDYDSALASNTRSLKEFAALINGAWRKGAGALFEAGQYLIDAKTELTGIEYKFLVTVKLSFNESTARKLTRIAKNETLCSHVNALPPHFTTLYALSQLKVEILESAIADGRVHPGMLRRDVTALKLKGIEGEACGAGGNLPPAESKPTFAAAWNKAHKTEEGRKAIRDQLDAVGRDGLCAVMSEALKTKFHDSILGQETKSEEIAARSVLGQRIQAASKNLAFALDATDKLHVALRNAELENPDNEAIGHMRGALKYIALAAGRRKIARGDIVIAVGKSKGKRK